MKSSMSESAVSMGQLMLVVGSSSLSLFSPSIGASLAAGTRRKCSSNLIFCSAETFCCPGQYIQWACMLSLSNPTHLPSLDCPPNLSFPSSCTQTLLPHSQSFERSGFLLLRASKGVLLFLRARVDVQFLSQTACTRASPQRNLGRPLWWSMAHTFSRRTQLRDSATPLCSGVSWVVNCCSVPWVRRWSQNSCARYLPPWSL